MANGETKGITVKVDADLHAEIWEYLKAHNMKMSEFVSAALENELHPKNDMKEGMNMGNVRTIAFQVPEELFHRIKDYLNRNNMTQRQFLLGLIEEELEREQTAREEAEAGMEAEQTVNEEEAAEDATEQPESDLGEEEAGEEEGISMGM